MTRDTRRETQERERTTIDDARKQGVGEADEGIEPTVPSYTETGGVSDLGVDEPVVPRWLRGDPPPDAGDGDDPQERRRKNPDTPQ